MSKVPPFEQLPFSSHRSISVREQTGHHSPHLRRSASEFHGSEQEALPVEIGSKGSIFSLLGRDTSVTRREDDAQRVSDASHYHVWHNRLWLLLPSASKKHNAAKQISKGANLETVVESEQEDGAPTWKRVLRKIIGGYNNSKYKSKWKKKGETLPNQSKKSTVNKRASIHASETARGARFTGKRNTEGDSMSPHCMPLQTDPSPVTTIWERRNFEHINPLDLEHLHTSRLKKAYAKPTGFT